jgi:hypothetical protein
VILVLFYVFFIAVYFSYENLFKISLHDGTTLSDSLPSLEAVFGFLSAMIFSHDTTTCSVRRV